MTNATTNNIQGLTVSALSSNRRYLRTMKEMSDTSSTDAVVASYVVTANIPGATYSSLSSQLATNVENGNFDNYLTSNVAIYGGSSQLASAASTSVATTSTLDDDSNGNDESSSAGISVGEVAGIAIGGVVGMSLLGGLFYWFSKKRSDEEPIVLASSGTTTVTKQNPIRAVNGSNNAASSSSGPPSPVPRRKSLEAKDEL